MTTPKLPGLNYAAPLTIDDLGHLEAVYTDEFARRILATVGSYRLAGGSFGIFSETDPTNASDSSDPFFVERNDTDGMTVNVYPAAGLTKSGMIVLLTNKVEKLAAVNQDIGQQNVVFVEYLTVPDEDTVVKTRFNTYEASQNIRSPDTSDDPLDIRTLQVASFQDWNNASLFPPERQENILPLALLTVVSTTTSPYKQISVDLSHTSLTTNRPWFSPVDITHRSEVGTGSSDIPHSLGLNDLSQGDLTLYDQLLNYGIVLGRDRDAPGVPGIVCLETITPARVEVDTTGQITGTLSQRFVRLTRYPIRLLGAYSISDTNNEILVDLIPHTNLLTIHLTEGLPVQGFRLQYSTVSAGEPLISSLINDEVHFRQPVATRELVVAGGRGHSTLTPSFTDSFGNERAKISLATSAAIPKRYRSYVDATGQLFYSPQHVLCSTRLDDLGTSAYNFNVTLLGSARMRVGITDVAIGPSLVVRVRITGTDANGSTITEDLQFNYANYELPDIGACEENPKNFQITNTIFTSVQSLMVLERVADGPNSVVMVYADLDPMIAEDVRDVCPLSEVFWNGEGICRIRDIRPVSSRLEVPTRTNTIKAVSQTLLADFTARGLYASELLGEDLRDPYRFKLVDPLRFFKLADGLRSSISPEQPGEESAGERLDQDIYTSQALRLVPGASRRVHMALIGHDADIYRMNGLDGIIPNVEFRTTPGNDPDAWTSWTVVDPMSYGNGHNFDFEIQDDTSFKIQLRVKGSVVGIAAIQYTASPTNTLITSDTSWHDIYSVFVDEQQSCAVYEAYVHTLRGDGEAAALYLVRFVARRGTAGDITLVGSPSVTALFEDVGALDVQVVTDIPTQTVKIQVKGTVDPYSWKVIAQQSWITYQSTF